VTGAISRPLYCRLTLARVIDLLQVHNRGERVELLEHVIGALIVHLARHRPPLVGCIAEDYRP
jgi:hypothetical protein